MVQLLLMFSSVITIITETYNSNYTEGVFLDYRHFDKYNITPRYYFGYGLSYTTFSFSSLLISKASEEHHVEQSFYRRRRFSSYINKDLAAFYEPVYTITFTITNTGSIDGSEVAQLYLSFPEEKQLNHKKYYVVLNESILKQVNPKL